MQVSDGQRRRVQMCMGLLKPFKILLLDEVTVDMDVLGRLELLRFFKRETEERGCTIIYATHIFDGLSDWMTHVAFVSDGAMVKGALPPLLILRWTITPCLWSNELMLACRRRC